MKKELTSIVLPQADRDYLLEMYDCDLNLAIMDALKLRLVVEHYTKDNQGDVYWEDRGTGQRVDYHLNYDTRRVRPDPVIVQCRVFESAAHQIR